MSGTVSQTTSFGKAALLGAALYFLLPRESRAEGSASYKFQSWQENDGRIRVDSHYGMVEQSLPADAKLKLIGLIDTIAGATPTGQLPVAPGAELPTATIDEERKAWQVEASKPFGRVSLSLGYAKSRESDYISDGLSLNTLTDFNQKNTTLLVGVAGTRDDVRVFYQTPWEKKRTRDFIVGVTQLLDPKTSVSVNLTYGKSTGYLSDPYKLIEKRIEVAPGLVLLRTFGENRPDEREKWIAYASVNRSMDTLSAAVEASYRLYHDDWGITAHTLTLEWFQKLWGDRLVLRPSVRWYQQSGADFYYRTLDGTAITPVNSPSSSSPAYSADYRLSKLSTVTAGAKLIINLVPERFSIDFAYERYAMNGRDSRVPAAAFVDANVFTAGAKFTW